MEYVPRLVDPILARLLTQVSAVMLVGPRACGKTTTATRLAGSIVRLDEDRHATAFRADPDAALLGLDEPVLLDEWQAVPGVLGAVKRAVDADPRRGRFIVTGSERAATQARWPGTGRLIRLPMATLTMREMSGRIVGPSFLERVEAGDALRSVDPPLDLRDYLGLALGSGFPDLLGADEDVRSRWLRSYIDHVLTRDTEQIEPGRDPGRMRRFLTAYAASTAGVVDDVTLYQAAGIDRRTAMAYERLLSDLHVVHSLPAWTPNLLKRLILSPKRHVVEPALAASILELTVDRVMRSGDLIGRLLESFVLSQLRPEVELGVRRPQLSHARQRQGRWEVDIIAELGPREVIAIEVKADSGPAQEDARHLARLRDEVGDGFVAGVVLHTGPRTYRLGDRISAAPISSLWSKPSP